MWKAKIKGNYYENESGKFWTKELGVSVKRTPRSGALYDWPGDIIIFGESVLKDFIIDVKSEQKLFTKKVLEYFLKNQEDAIGKKSFLEIYVNFDKNSPYILINRSDFAKIIKELDGYRKESIEGKEK